MAVTLSSVTAFAQSLTEGFFRVQNSGSGRYLYVRDCTGDVSTLGADMGAIELWSGLDNAISDPSSVILMIKSGSQWDMQSQTTGVYKITGRLLNVSDDGEYCQLYNSGQYLYEVGVSDFNPDQGFLGAKTNKEMPGMTQYRLWKVYPVSSSSDNYFGFTPTVETAGKKYASFYADFAYEPNDAVKTWYVKSVDKENSIAVIAEIYGTVAKGQAVFVECPSASASGNKIDLTTANGNGAVGNKLTGVYFSNADRSGKSHYGYDDPAVVVFDKSTMRVLGTDNEGNLAFVTSGSDIVRLNVKINNKWQDVDCILHNKAYLSVDADCPETLRVMNEAEYEEYIASGIIDLKSNSSSSKDVIYDTCGRIVGSSIESLTKGIYIIDGKKIMIN